MNLGIFSIIAYFFSNFLFISLILILTYGGVMKVFGKKFNFDTPFGVKDAKKVFLLFLIISVIWFLTFGFFDFNNLFFDPSFPMLSFWAGESKGSVLGAIFIIFSILFFFIASFLALAMYAKKTLFSAVYSILLFIVVILTYFIYSNFYAFCWNHFLSQFSFCVGLLILLINGVSGFYFLPKLFGNFDNGKFLSLLSKGIAVCIIIAVVLTLL